MTTDAHAPSTAFQPGLYKHYKGGLYTALCLVTHHETREPMVLYVSHLYGGVNVRPLRGWQGESFMDCTDNDGWLDTVHHEGKIIPRFTFMKTLPQNEPLFEGFWK